MGLVGISLLRTIYWLGDNDTTISQNTEMQYIGLFAVVLRNKDCLPAKGLGDSIDFGIRLLPKWQEQQESTARRCVQPGLVVYITKEVLDRIHILQRFWNLC